jgi:hypothetical protein
MLLREGDAYRRAAQYNAPPNFEEFCKNTPILRRGIAPSVDRVIDTRQTSHILDVATEDPNEPIGKFAGARTLIVVPMLKDRGRPTRSRTLRLLRSGHRPDRPQHT